MTNNHLAKNLSLRGFSIMELTMVVAIIGLLAGAILYGAGLGKSAETRNFARDLARFEAAVTTFNDKYQALPGDMVGAVAMWGSAGGDGKDAACQNTASLSLATCDGNGNYRMDDSVVPLDESHRAWQHLKNAELVDGRFVGTTNGISLERLLIDTLPGSKIANIGYQFRNEDKVTLGWFDPPEGTVPLLAIRVAAPYTGADAPRRLGTNALSGYQMFILDEKVDDGKPGLGKIFAVFTGSAGCVSSNDAKASTYFSGNEAPGCFFHYDLAK